MELAIEHAEKYLSSDENEGSSDAGEEWYRSNECTYESWGFKEFLKQRQAPSKDSSDAKTPQQPIARRVQPSRNARPAHTLRESSDEEMNKENGSAEDGVEDKESAGDEGSADDEESGDDSSDDNGDGDGDGGDDGSGGEGRMGGSHSVGDTHSSAMQVDDVADSDSDAETARELEAHEASLSQQLTQRPDPKCTGQK